MWRSEPQKKEEKEQQHTFNKFLNLKRCGFKNLKIHLFIIHYHSIHKCWILEGKLACNGQNDGNDVTKPLLGI